MNNKTKCLSVLLFVLAAVILLSACSDSGTKEKAEGHMEKLREVFPDDVFMITKTPGLASRADPLTYTVASEKYNDTFSIWVSRDGNTVTDSYYTLDFREAAGAEAEAFIAEILDRKIELDVNLTPISSPTLSAVKLTSLTELCRLADNGQALKILLHPTPGDQPAEDEVNRILKGFKDDRCWYCTFYPYGDDIEWYDISENGVWKTRKSGADSGRMLERRAYQID